MSSSLSPSWPKGQSNLESFLHSVTPVVPPRPLPMNLQQAVDNTETVKYFSLGNLWKIYNEWSAYGVGVPLMLSSEEPIVQYYIPYLSAIQLYTNRKKRGDNTSKNCGDALINSNTAHDSWQAGEWDPYFQYDETTSPYWRIPFANKIAEFGETLPELVSLKSTELSPASWMSVIWSPIYHIPFKRKVEDLSTQFITFHTLSSHFQDTQGSNDISAAGRNINFPYDFAQAKSKFKSHRNISLPPFGLSTLKMQGDVWINQNSGDYEKLIDLHCAADSWLKQLGVYNQDFDYYKQKNLEAGSIFK